MQVIPWSAMKNPMRRAVNGARGTMKFKISGVYLGLHTQYQFVWAWTFNKYFPSGVDACAASHRDSEPTSDIYSVCQVTQFHSV